MPDGFQKFVPALRRWLTRRVRSEVDVDDALQDIWRTLGLGAAR